MNWQKGQAFYPSTHALTHSTVQNDDYELVANFIVTATVNSIQSMQTIKNNRE